MSLMNHYQLREQDKQIKKIMQNDLNSEKKINGGYIFMTSGYKDQSLKVLSLNSNPALAEEIANHIGTSLGKCIVSKFSDGEIQINLEESVRGCDVYEIGRASCRESG